MAAGLHVLGSKGVEQLLFSANLSFLFNGIESFVDRYKAAKEVGFSGVECGQEIYNFPLMELVKAKEDNYVEQVLMNSFVGKSKGLASSPKRISEFQHCLELSIEYCKALKCKRLHVLAGEYPRDIKNNATLTEECEQTYINNLKYAGDRLKLEGILVLIEPISTIPNYFLTRTDQALDILEKVNNDNVKLLLDLYHHQVTHGNIINTITENLNRIGHIQISQVPGRHEPDTNGEINYKYVFSHLLKLKYNGWLGCEYIPSDELSPFAWMYSYAYTPQM